MRNSGFMSFAKGIGTGAVIGMAAYAVGTTMMNNNKHLKKKISHTARTVGDILENVSDIIR